MFKLSVSQEEIDGIKGELFHTLAQVKSSHRVEAVARGLGFKTNAALCHALKSSAVDVELEPDAFSAYLREHGYIVDYTSLLRAVAKIAIKQVMQKTPNLTHFWFGIYYDRNQTIENRMKEFEKNRKAMLTEYATDEFLIAMEFASHLQLRKTLNKSVTSYGLKHQAERFFQANPRPDRPGHGYIINGMMIVAAIHLGFKAASTHHGSPNAYFNVSLRNLSDLRLAV